MEPESPIAQETPPKFVGGVIQNNNGVRYTLNLPTEEVFTTPHKLFTEGKAVVTRPILINGKLIEG